MNQNEIEQLLEVELDEGPLLDLGGVRWRPTLGSVSQGVALHICETSSLGPSISRRIAEALAAGLRVCVLLPLGPVGLNLESQEALLPKAVEVIAPSGQGGTPVLYRDLAEAVRKQGVLLDTELSTAASAQFIEEASALSGDQRGRALERALAFSSSQIPGWEVDSVNYRTENEELDIIVANNSAKAPWNGTGYILLESKNWSNNVDRPEYDAFHMKVMERGGFCRLGIIVASTGFSAGFYSRAEHHGTEHFSIVPITTEWLVGKLREGSTIEEALALRVRQVVLDRQWDESA